MKIAPQPARQAAENGVMLNSLLVSTDEVVSTKKRTKNGITGKKMTCQVNILIKIFGSSIFLLSDKHHLGSNDNSRQSKAVAIRED